MAKTVKEIAEVLFALEVNAETGEEITRPLTQDEIDDRNKKQAEFEATLVSE